MVERYGSRPVAMIGSFIAAVALFCGAWVNNLTELYVVYGLAGKKSRVTALISVILFKTIQIALASFQVFKKGLQHLKGTSNSLIECFECVFFGDNTAIRTALL